jgi:8-oxo-dGTP diphosphatase
MKSDYDFVSTTNMLIINDRKLLVIKRSEKLKDFPGWLMLPGGKQEVNETPQQAAIRETFEETGLKAVNPKLKVVATHNHFYRKKVYLVYIFVANEFSGKLKSSKEGKALWIPLDKALKHDKLYPDLKRHIRLATESDSQDVIFTYHKFNKDLEIIEKI